MDAAKLLCRDYHESLGWTVALASGRVAWYNLMRPDGSVRYSAIEPETCWHYLPALHEDANLAIAELDRVFHIDDSQWKGGNWTIHRELGMFFCRVPWAKNKEMRRLVYEGATFNEAALKALVAARTR